MNTSKRRWLRFSLRTMLILLVPLSLYLAYRANEAHRQRRFMNLFRRLDGGIAYLDEFDPWGNALGLLPRRTATRSSRATSLRDVDDIAVVQFWQGTPVTNADLELLAQLPHLRRLSLRGSQVTDAGLAHIVALDELRSLNLGHCAITDVSLRHIARLKNLESLQLDGTQVTDEGLAHLKALPKLRSLSLSATQTSDNGVDALIALKKLGNLVVQNTEMTEAGIIRLQRAKPKTVIHSHRFWRDAASDSPTWRAANADASSRASHEEAAVRTMLGDLLNAVRSENPRSQRAQITRRELGLIRRWNPQEIDRVYADPLHSIALSGTLSSPNDSGVIAFYLNRGYRGWGVEKVEFVLLRDIGNVLEERRIRRTRIVEYASPTP